MSGYLSGSTSLSVTDTCWSTINNYGVYGDKATASATVSVSAGSNTASYSITVTTTDFNFIQIYLKVGDTVVKNEKDTGGKKTYSYSGTVNISGGSIAVKLGVGCSQYDESNMSFTNNTLSRTYWSDVGKGSIICTDNYNNSFTITASAGASGTNNAVRSYELWTAQYKYSNGSWMWGNSSSTLTQTIALGGLTNDPTRPVAAWIRTHPTYGSYSDYSNSYTIKQYREPIFPANFEFTLTKTRNRLTIKEPWVFSWTAANAINTTSSVKGYRIRLYKNDVEIPIKNSSGQVISLTNSIYGGHPYDTDSTSTSFTIYPDQQGFVAGDTVSILVHAYTRYGANNERTGESNCLFSSSKKSINYEVQNAGIVQVRTASGWHEGQVWVRTASGWHEAETVQVRAASGWHESE